MDGRMNGRSNGSELDPTDPKYLNRSNPTGASNPMDAVAFERPLLDVRERGRRCKEVPKSKGGRVIQHLPTRAVLSS